MKIIVADRISEHGVKLLADPGWQVVQPAAASLASELADADALVVRSATRVTDELLNHARQLRVIGRAGVGVDNIDLDAATRRGILVMNTPGGNAPSVAEHALALMLSMARSIPQLNASMHAGKWEKSGPPALNFAARRLASSVSAALARKWPAARVRSRCA
jgi:D-3-phosphoglycerate dehydrogenase